MKTNAIIKKLENRIEYLRLQYHPELGEHRDISGLMEAVRIIKKAEELKKIDWTLQTR